jgi:hypothetical protein
MFQNLKYKRLSKIEATEHYIITKFKQSNPEMILESKSKSNSNFKQNSIYQNKPCTAVHVYVTEQVDNEHKAYDCVI